MPRPSWDSEPRRPRRPSPPDLPASKPANPAGPTPPGSSQAAGATAGQQAGWAAGNKDWDPDTAENKRWAQRIKRELPGESGNLDDPEYRKHMNRMLNDLRWKKKGKAKTATAPATAPVEEEGAAGGENETPGQAGTGLPTAQGSAGQVGKMLAGDQALAFPTRRVPGEEGAETPKTPTADVAPGIQTGLWGPEDEARAGETRTPSADFPGGQTGLWGAEDEARAAGEGATRPTTPGGAGTSPTGEPYLTNEMPTYAEGPQGQGGSTRATPIWPPAPSLPTYYSGGM